MLTSITEFTIEIASKTKTSSESGIPSVSEPTVIFQFTVSDQLEVAALELATTNKNNRPFS